MSRQKYNSKKIHHTPHKEHIVFPRDKLDPEALKVVNRLRRYHHEAYLVGGCVRDLLLNRTPKDFDVATSATPQEIRSLFRNCRIIGRRFKLAHIFFGKHIIETSTFRDKPEESESCLTDPEPELDNDADTQEEKGPNPLLIKRDNVFGNAEQDAKRRDFTINGLFYIPKEGTLIDYVGGLEDIRSGVVRTIGDPRVRFREDPVRILRAIKFASRLHMRIEPPTHDAMFEYRKEISFCPPARVLEEIRRLLSEGTSRPAVEFMDSLSVLEVLLPEVSDALQTPQKAGPVRKRLDAMDRAIIKHGFSPSRALLLGNLLLETLDPHWLDQRDVGNYLIETLKPLLHRLRVPRRDKDTLSQIFIAQRRLLPGGSKRRIRSLAKHAFFAEALYLCALGTDPNSTRANRNLDKILELAQWPKDTFWTHAQETTGRNKTKRSKSPRKRPHNRHH